MANPDWTVYVKTRCPWCADAVSYLRKHGYDFREIDILRDPAASTKMRELSGQTLTPTLVIENTGAVLPDFDVGQLETFLKEQGLLKPVA